MLRNREDCMLRIGIIGNIAESFQCSSIDILRYDTNPELCVPPDTTLDVLELCDLLFFSIPMASTLYSPCDTTILSESIALLTHPYKIICSSVPMGYSQSVGCHLMIPDTTQWVLGMVDTPYTEECKKRIMTLHEICHREGTVLHDIIRWVSATEVEAAIMYQTILSETVKGISNEVDAFLIKNNINNISLVKDLCHPEMEGHLHHAYQQFQMTDVSFPILEHVMKEINATSDKKISLVIGSRNNKMTEDVCRNLIRKDNIVILFSDIPTLLLDTDGNIMKDVISNTGSFRHKQFFPKLDYIWDFSRMDSSIPCTYTDRTNALIETMNKLELVKTHHCSLTFLSDHDVHDELLSAFINEYPEYRNKVEMIHILFDKSVMSDYVLQ